MKCASEILNESLFVNQFTDFLWIYLKILDFNPRIYLQILLEILANLSDLVVNYPFEDTRHHLAEIQANLRQLNYFYAANVFTGKKK